MGKKICKFIENIFILLFIALNLLDFINLLPPDLDFIKKIISWTFLLVIFYNIDFTKMIFGSSDKRINFLIVSCFLLLVINKFITILTLSEMGPMFKTFILSIVENIAVIGRSSFIIASYLLIIISIYLAIRIRIKDNSIMGMIHESGKAPKSIIKIMIRAFVILIVLLAFYITLFDHVIEWLTIILDSPLIVISILIAIFYSFKKGYFKKDFSYMLSHISDFGEKLYLKLVSMFYNKNTVLLGFLGVFVLYLVIDLSGVVMHYLLVYYQPFYIKALESVITDNIYALMVSDINNAPNILYAAPILLNYIFSSFGIIILLISPAYIWYKYVLHKKIFFSRMWSILILTSITSFFFSQIFMLKSIKNSYFTGVLIQTASLGEPFFAAFMTISVFALTLIFSKYEFVKKSLISFSLMAISIFLIKYLYLLVLSISDYYINSIIMLFLNKDYLISFFFLTFFAISIIFYSFGLLYMLKITYENVKD